MMKSLLILICLFGQAAQDPPQEQPQQIGPGQAIDRALIIHSKQVAELYKLTDDLKTEAEQAAKVDIQTAEALNHLREQIQEQPAPTPTPAQLPNIEGKVFSGRHVLDDSLVIPHSDGWAIVGAAGQSGWMFEKSVYRGNPSATRLEGLGLDHIIEYRGQGLYIDQVTLYGSTRDEARKQGVDLNRPWECDNAAKVGLYLERPQGGLGTGKISAPSLGIYGCETAIQANGRGNCDHFWVGFLNLGYNKIGFQTNNRNNVEYTLDHVRSIHNEILFDFKEGGKLTGGRVAMATPGTVLRIGEPRLGGGTFTIDNLVLDNGSLSKRLVVVECTQPSYANVTICNTHWPHDARTKELLSDREEGLQVYNLVGPQRLNLVGDNRLPNGIISAKRTKEGLPTIIVTGVRFSPGSSPEDLVVDGSQCRLIVDQCISFDGTEYYSDIVKLVGE